MLILTTPEQDRVIETSPSISLSQVQPVTELVEEQINQELRYHVNSGLSPSQPEASAPIETSQVFTQEFRYRMPEAGEVLLVLGVNGWGTLPEADRPAGTVVQSEVMRTRMNQYRFVNLRR